MECAKLHRFHILATAAILAWCLPYFTTGNRIEYGDFSFFAQAYEAIRTTIVDYHQFPWWNPWMAGGIPLYANPQIGVFSIQTILVILFGAVTGLKLAVVCYTLAGYASMYILLQRYFKVNRSVAILLSLAWVFCSFFVAHLPAHFTFVWYLLAPLYTYLALTIKSLKGGLILGSAFAVMALSAVHNPFFHIAFVVGLIILVRLVIEKRERFMVAKGALLAGVVLILIAGHRMFLVYQMVRSFNHIVTSDPPINPIGIPFALFMPFVRHFYLNGIGWYPSAPFSWGEATATPGFFISLAAAIGFFVASYRLVSKRYKRKPAKILFVLSGLILVIAAIAVGNAGPPSPYWFIKQLPIFGEMRVSTRWLLWAVMALMIFVGVFFEYIHRQKRLQKAILCLCGLGVIELFVSNFGYQANVLQYPAIEGTKKVSDYSFTQVDTFETQHDLPGKAIPDDNKGPMFYREYEATTFNIGVVRANEPLVDNRYKKARCVDDSGCGFVLSNNAVVTWWSPNKVVLERTANGPISLNINDSYYYKVNGLRHVSGVVSGVESNLTLDALDSVKTITLTVSPDYIR